MINKLIIPLIVCILNVTVLTTSLNAEVDVITLNKLTDIYPHRPWTDITPEGEGKYRLTIEYAYIPLWQDDLLILSTRLKSVESGGGSGCNNATWARYRIDLVYLDDPDLIERILDDPNKFEKIVIHVNGAEGTLVDPDPASFDHFDPLTWHIQRYPISYHRKSIYDCDTQG